MNKSEINEYDTKKINDTLSNYRQLAKDAIWKAESNHDKLVSKGY